VAWFRTIVVFTAVASVFAFVVLLGFGALVQTQIEADSRHIIVRDALGQRVHRLSGMVMVPSDCHELISRAMELDVTNYLLMFRTWEDPNRVCNNEDMPRQFNLTVFAPSTGVAFQAMLDDVSIPLTVIPTIE